MCTGDDVTVGANNTLPAPLVILSEKALVMASVVISTTVANLVISRCR